MAKAPPLSPLAERMRPRSLDEFVGQEHLLHPGRLLRGMIHGSALHSVILWGPPGSGKTTLARLLATAAGAAFVPLSAVTVGIKDVRRIIQEAAANRTSSGTQTVLFIDEIHRFNKAQQDAFLPHVEHGDIVLIGATTENPSFEVVSPLLSRAKVLVLEALGNEHIRRILRTALSDTDRGLGNLNVRAGEDALDLICAYSQGDARVALNTLEMAVILSQPDDTGTQPLTEPAVREALQAKMLQYDKSGEEHYNLISALHKSLRSSDVDASLYWLARMVEAGEDPLYIARRLVRFASEDVGMADPRALEIAMAAKEAFHFIGLPEGKLALAQAAVYLATAPKSNALYRAYTAAAAEARRSGTLPVPLHLRNAPTRLMRDLGYGKDYQYDHNLTGGVSSQKCLPDGVAEKRFYVPGDRGFEKIIRERLEFISRKKKERG